MSKTHKWTQSEIEILKQLYPKGGTKECLKYLSFASSDRIVRKANEIGLVRLPTQQRLYLDRVAILGQYDKNTPVNFLMKKYRASYKNMVKFLRSQGREIRNESFYRKLYYDKTYFNRIDSHEKAYWLGYIGADGNLFKNRLSISCVDKGQLEKFKQAIRGEQAIMYSKKIIYKFAISDEILKNQMLNLGIRPRKSLVHPFPTEQQVPNRFVNSYILGYFDGDGCIYYRKNKNGFRWGFSIIAAPAFVEECLRILCKEFKFFMTKISDRPPMKVIVFGGAYKDRIKRIYDFLYKNIDPNIPLARKKRKIEFLIERCRERPQRLSKYNGVYKFGKSKRWSAVQSIKGKIIRLGGFNTERQAAIAVDKLLIEHGLRLDRLNFPLRVTRKLKRSQLEIAS